MERARVVADRYSLVRPLGRGSRSEVYVAQRPDGRAVALKLIPARPALADAQRRAFEEGVRELSEAAPSGTLPYLDAGHASSHTALFLAMELLHGESLSERLAERGAERADPTALIDDLESALEPLARLHEAGLAHGALTASNVFFVRRRAGPRAPRLLDAGLAALLCRWDLAAPVRGSTLGPHLAPERRAGSPPSPAADVWSFGALLHEALTGAPPGGPPADGLAAAHGGLAELATICLDPDPRRRPPDGRALLRLCKTLRSPLGRADRVEGLLDTVLDPDGAAPAPPPEALEATLWRAPRDPEAHRGLRQHYAASGAPDGEWLTSAALVFLRAARGAELRRGSAPPGPAGPDRDRGLTASGWAALLHPDQDPRLDAVWAATHEALARLHAQPTDEAQAGELARVDYARPQGPLAEAFRAAVSAVRPAGLPRLYRGRPGAPPRYLRTELPTSVFPSGFEEPLPRGALPFAVARHVAFYRPAHRVCTLLTTPESLERAFVAALDVGLGELDRGDAEAGAHARALADALGEAQRGALRRACVHLGANRRRADLGTWRRAVELSCLRAGVALGADLEGAAWMLRWTREHRRLSLEDALDEVLRFWSSGDHTRVRSLLGMAPSR